jgi:hypothetical protein
MDEKRNFPRFAIELDAKFITADGKESPCKLTDISREGTCIEFFSKEKIEIGTGIKLEITAAKKESPINAAVIIMWVTELDDNTEYHYLAGGLLSEIVSEDKDYLLDQAYAIFKEKN